MDLPTGLQDGLATAALILPVVGLAMVMLRGYAPVPLVRAMLWRFRGTVAIFVVVVAVAVAMGVGLIAQERGLRAGTARAADGFDIVVTAPGSEVTMMLASVYLQPTDAPLLDGATYNRIAGAEHVTLAAPLAFGDSYGAAPVVGTTAPLVMHLAGGGLAEGHLFDAVHHAVAGARVPLAVGETFVPAHGVGDGADHHAHDTHFEVVGRMPVTGTPWDNALIVPIEAVWSVHGLADGHDPDHAGEVSPEQVHDGDHDHDEDLDEDHGADHGDHDHEGHDAPPGHAEPEAGERDHGHDHDDAPQDAPLGGPFDAAHFPGTPAIVVKADSLAASYALRSDFTRDNETMAFFPGTVLAQLYGIMGDLREAMSLMALVAEALVAVSVLVGLFILTRLFSRHLALLRALGAPGRYVMAVVWSFSALLLAAGAALGLAGGILATWILSGVVSRRTGIDVPATLGWSEIQLVAGFLLISVFFALLPAWAALRQPVSERLRG